MLNLSLSLQLAGPGCLQSGYLCWTCGSIPSASRKPQSTSRHSLSRHSLGKEGCTTDASIAASSARRIGVDWL